MTEDRRRALDAVLSSLETACEVAEEPWGTFVVNPEFHRIHMANFLWLRTLPEEGLPAMLARMEEVFAPLRVRDRQLFVEDEVLAESLTETLAARGFVRKSEHMMFARHPSHRAPNPAVSIRPARDQATRDDHDEIAGLGHEEQGYDHEVSHQLLALHWRRVAQLGSEVFVAYVDGKPAGNVAIDGIGGVGELYEVETVPSRRRRGIASAMIHAMRARATDRGLEPFFLRTTFGHETFRMYEKLGFDRDGVLEEFVRAAA